MLYSRPNDPVRPRVRLRGLAHIRPRWAALLLVALAHAPAAAAGEVRPPVEVPYRLTDTLHVLVRAKINGRGPFNFILDTGAPAVFVAEEIGKELGLKSDARGWAVLDSFEVEGGAVLRNQRVRVDTPFQLQGMNGLGLPGAKLHGMIGYSVLARYRVELDFTRDKMIWTPLDYQPSAPQGLDGRGGAAGGLDALGAALQVVGTLLGKQPDRVLALRGMLGIEVADADGSVRVQSVLPGSAASTAGLRPGDRLTRFQGNPVRTTSDLLRAAARLGAGKVARVEVSRGLETHKYAVTLAEGF